MKPPVYWTEAAFVCLPPCETNPACLGEPGAVIVGRLVEAGKPVARLWTCAILHDDAGYMLVSRIAEPVEKDEENSARRIVDATELTHLAELAPAPAPSN